MRRTRAIPLKRRLVVSLLLPALFAFTLLYLSSEPVFTEPASERIFGWSQINSDGFGTPANIGCLGMSAKDGHLYFGTWATIIGASVLRYDGSGFTVLAGAGFGNIGNYAAGTMLHDDTVYAGTFNLFTGCELRRYDGGTSWTRVDGGTSPGNGGFGDANNWGTFSGISHDGVLFIGTENRVTGGEVWRYDGGTSWTRVDGGTSPGNGGFGDANNTACHLQVYDGRIYSTTQNPTTGFEVWRYGGGTSWTRVDGGASPGNGGFGDANNQLAGFVIYEEELYTYTKNEATGGEVWRYGGGTSWTRVDGGASPGNGGFGDANNTAVYVATVYNGRLYAGTVNDDGCEIWEYDGTAWTKVIGGGFGDANNIAARSMAACQGNLIVATGNNITGTEIWLTKTAPEWYLAEGATAGGFETWVLVQNPGPDAVRVDFTLNTGEGVVVPEPLQNVEIAGGSRRSFNIGNYVTTYDVSTKVSARNGDIICERAMYWTPPGSANRVLGHDSVGVTASAGTWYLAEGATAGGFETWVLVQNPGPDAVRVDFTLNTGEGVVVPEPLQNVEIAGGSRRSFNIGNYVTTYDVSTKVSARNGDIICERAMYWTPPGSANRVLGHDSVGFDP
jgi:hypothetical protein